MEGHRRNTAGAGQAVSRHAHARRAANPRADRRREDHREIADLRRLEGVHPRDLPRTVDHHRANICTKLELHGFNALVKFATAHRSELS
jgi:hypothetical protein